MLKIPAIFFCLLFSAGAFAQAVIKGIVINQSTGQPVAGSSVFISNSSRGTVTGNDGQFELTHVPAGKHELVVSCIGYETHVLTFSETQLPLQLNIQLAIKVKELENVTVEPFVEEGWNKWGKLFTQHFIGTSENAGQCKIKNTGKIRFRYYKKSNRVVAVCDEPVLIENNALGYRIKYQLESFELNFIERTTSYLGYSLFEDMSGEGKEPKEKWVKRRSEAFKGSVTHFMRALYRNRLPEEGFEVRRYVRRLNNEKERIRKIYLPSATVTQSAAGTTPVIRIDEKLPGVPEDSSAYYRRVMQQPEIIEEYGMNTLNADSLVVATEGKYKGLYFADYLYITYKGEKEEKAYLLSTMQGERPLSFQRSIVQLLNEELITFDEMGNYYNPLNFFASGYWGWSEKIASLLPSDYKPVE